MAKVIRVAIMHQTSEMGGAEFSTLFLASNIDSKRFNVVVVCPTHGALAERCKEKGIIVQMVSHLPTFSVCVQIGTRYIVNPIALLWNPLAMLLTAIRLSVWLRRHGTTLACTKGMFAHFYGGVAAKLARIPCVWHVQDFVNERPAFGLWPRLLRLGAKFLAKSVIADGAVIAEQLGLNGKFVVPTTVVHNGVDTSEFRPGIDGTSVRHEFGFTPNDIVVGTVARLTPWKGQEYLIEAAASLNDEFLNLRFLVVGSPVFDNDAYEVRLKQMVKKLGLDERVIFTGFRWDLPQVLAAMDVFVHPATMKDTSPLSMVSAMAMGLPLVITDVPGQREIVSEKEAIVIPPRDSIALAEAIQRLMNEPKHRCEIGAKARRKAVAELSVENFVRKCESVFHHATADKHGSRI